MKKRRLLKRVNVWSLEARISSHLMDGPLFFVILNYCWYKFINLEFICNNCVLMSFCEGFEAKFLCPLCKARCDDSSMPYIK